MVGRKDTRDVLDALDEDWDEKDSGYDNVGITCTFVVVIVDYVENFK